ncbi:14865_t:CDS:10, partial [Dentiscutata erythropus]
VSKRGYATRGDICVWPSEDLRFVVYHTTTVNICVYPPYGLRSVNHREKYPDVQMFWNDIEASVANSSLQLDKVNTARTVMHGTERLIKTAFNEVDSTLKTNVSNNGPNERKRPVEEPSPVTTPPNLRNHSPPPFNSMNNSFNGESTEIEKESIEASPELNVHESDIEITHEDYNENPFDVGDGSRNHKWVVDGHNISLDFRKFQLASINLLETNPTFLYVKDMDRILQAGICNMFRNKIRPRLLVPKMLPSVVHLIIIEYNMLLNDKQLLDTKWHENWAKWSTLSTDEDKSIFDCAQEVTKNFFTYLTSVSFDEDKKLDEDTFVHRYCHRLLEEIFSKDDFTLIWANGESESSKERRILDGKNHGRKPDFRILSKIDDVNTEFLFGEIKPPNNSTSINKSIVKLAEFTKGSLDLIIYSYGYVDGLETFGVLIHGSEIKIFSMDLAFDGLYRFNQLSKILLPTENANFLNIITVISTFYSLLERIRSTIVTMNSSQPSSSGHLYCRKSNSSPKKIRIPIVRA